MSLVIDLTELSELSAERDRALDEGRYDDADAIERDMERVRREMRIRN